MLEDNYSMVYWEQRIDDELRKRYPRLYEQEDIESIAVTTTYSLMPIDSGTSPAADDNGVAIPLEPKHEYTLDVRLRTDSISEALWQEFYAVVPDLAAAGRRWRFMSGAETKNGWKAAREPRACTRRWCCSALR